MRARDMTRREFNSALRRHGWKQELMWITGTDKSGHTCGIGMVMTKKGRRGYRFNRRATLAKAKRELLSADI